MKKIILLLILTISFAGLSAQQNSYKQLKAELFAEEIAKKGTQLVDIRTTSEYAKGHIKGAINIDAKANNYLTLIKKLKQENTVALYCRSGARSKVMAQKLTTQGYKVVILQGGLLEWHDTLIQ